MGGGGGGGGGGIVESRVSTVWVGGYLVRCICSEEETISVRHRWVLLYYQNLCDNQRSLCEILWFESQKVEDKGSREA